MAQQCDFGGCPQEANYPAKHEWSVHYLQSIASHSRAIVCLHAGQSKYVSFRDRRRCQKNSWLGNIWLLELVPIAYEDFVEDARLGS